jgi:hypothetical protein
MLQHERREYVTQLSVRNCRPCWGRDRSGASVSVISLWIEENKVRWGEGGKVEERERP